MIVSPAVDAAIAGILGLMIGSFLNVVIHRLPRMVARDWLKNANDIEAAEDLHEMVFARAPAAEWKRLTQERARELDDVAPLTLMRPRSRCPHCGHAIKWYENIPIVSWLALRGRCSACAKPIGIRYPVVEALTGGLFALCVARWGVSLQAAAWCAFSAILICQFLIDMDTQYLPEELNYPLLWLGLLSPAFGVEGWQITATQALWGAALGWLVLWLPSKMFQLLRGYEGMGVGDFKLLAAITAWFGAKYLLALLLMSSIVGAAVGIAIWMFSASSDRQTRMPFGPYLAGAGIVCLVIGPERMPSLFRFAFPFGG